MPKIISKCCELVKLCHINRSGPVFFETQCITAGDVDVSGPLAVIFACWSRHTAAMDWEGAHNKGRIAFCLSATGLSITAVIVLVLVLLLYTKDT